ncbi:hypothetical protein EDB85DRAFT_1875839, partial [Lactarius pseudohatsudake]
NVPRDKGVTSRRRMSVTLPARTPPWMEAPIAIVSPGLTPLEGSRPKVDLTVSTTRGIRVIPPTRMTSLLSDVLMPASLSAFLQGSIEH